MLPAVAVALAVLVRGVSAELARRAGLGWSSSGRLSAAARRLICRTLFGYAY